MVAQIMVELRSGKYNVIKNFDGKEEIVSKYMNKIEAIGNAVNIGKEYDKDTEIIIKSDTQWENNATNVYTTAIKVLNVN